MVKAAAAIIKAAIVLAAILLSGMALNWLQLFLANTIGDHVIGGFGIVYGAGAALAVVCGICFGIYYFISGLRRGTITRENMPAVIASGLIWAAFCAAGLYLTISH